MKLTIPYSLLAVLLLPVQASSQAATGTTSGSTLEIGAWEQSRERLRHEWPTFGNGPSHTGYFPDAIASAAFQPDWTAALGQDLQQVAVGGGRVYVTPWQYFGQAWLRALDEADGHTLWTYVFDECYSINPPTYYRGQVYVQRGNHGSDTQLWSVHADSGTPLWIAPHSAQWERYMAPTVAAGRVWVNGGSYGGLYGFRLSDGVQLFFQGLPQYDGWTPSWYAGGIHTWVEGVFRRQDPDSGVTSWWTDLGWDWAGWSMNRTAAIANGRAFVVGNPNLYALDLSSHQVAWSASGSFRGTPAVANGVVYVLAAGFVNAYDAWNGDYLGVYPGENDLLDQPIVADDMVIFASSSRTFLYRRATFQLLASVPFGGHLSLANGRLYIASDDGQLRAFTIQPTARERANLTADWKPWAPGADANVTRLAITNHGATRARPCLCAVLLSSDTQLDGSDTVLRLVKLPGLDPGEILTAPVELTTELAFSGRYLLWVPDTSNVVPETNENNVTPSGAIP